MGTWMGFESIYGMCNPSVFDVNNPQSLANNVCARMSLFNEEFLEPRKLAMLQPPPAREKDKEAYVAQEETDSAALWVGLGMAGMVILIAATAVAWLRLRQQRLRDALPDSTDTTVLETLAEDVYSPVRGLGLVYLMIRFIVKFPPSQHQLHRTVSDTNSQW